MCQTGWHIIYLFTCITLHVILHVFDRICTNVIIFVCVYIHAHEFTHTNTHTHTHKLAHTHTPIPIRTNVVGQMRDGRVKGTKTLLAWLQRQVQQNCYSPQTVQRTLFSCVYPHVSRDFYTCVPWLIRVCHMTESRVWLESRWTMQSNDWVSHELNASRHTCEEVIWITCVTCLIGQCSPMTYVWLISYVWLHMCDMTQWTMQQRKHLIYAWHYSCPIVTWLIHMCDMTHSYVWLDSVDNAAAEKTLDICVTLLVPNCDMTHSYVWHDSFICVTWLSGQCSRESTWYMRDTTRAQLWHDALICVTWLIHMCDMTHSYVWHDSLNRQQQRKHSTCVGHYSCSIVTWLIHMCDMTH